MFSEISPNVRHLRITMYYSTCIGLWPFEFKNNPILKKIYNFYSISLLVYHLLFTSSAFAKLIMLLSDEAGATVDEISGNLTITLIYAISFVRQLCLRSNAMRNILKIILETEERILRSGDNRVKKIYEKVADETVFFSKIYILIICVVTILYYMRPLMIEDTVKVVNNITVHMRSLPLSSWMPFDEQKYYFRAYVWDIFDGILGSNLLLCADIFTYSIITYPTGQLKILSHVLRNFEEYKRIVRKQGKIENKEEASFITMREAIILHKSVIKIINTFNATMGNLMVADFLQCSLQLACILTQVIGRELSPILLAYITGTFLSMFLRLVLYYYNANEIIVESQGLNTAMWETKWYEEPPKVKFLVLFFLVRSKNALTLNIGPFATMSLAAFLSVLKATYSYIMLMFSLN